MAESTMKSSPDSPLLAEFTPPSLEDWHAEAVRLLKGVPFDKKMLTRTWEGITLKGMYTREDAADLEHPRSLPGEAPFVRGTTPLGYKLQPWEVAQELPYPTYEEFNEALRDGLARGQTAVNLILDEATQAGLDPDQAEQALVGRGGTSIASVIGLGSALDGVDLEETPIYIQAGSAALPVAALLVAWMRREGQDVRKLRGTIGLDPLAGLAIHGRLPLTLERAFDEMAVLTRWTVAHAPRVHTVEIYGHPYHNSGASAVQELAIALSAGVEYLRRLEERGLSVDQVAPRTLFAFSVGSNFFMEMAKLRAARMLWARVVEASGGSKEARKMTIHARTSSFTKTALDPWVNILRSTTEAFSAVMAGVDSLHISPFDEVLGLPRELPRRLARNTHTILREEAHFDAVLDPAGGSWYLESLTDEVAHRAWELFQQIEAEGGLAEALRSGMVQTMIAETGAERRKAAASRRDSIVGVNQYPNPAEHRPEPNWPDYGELARRRTQRLQELRTSQEQQQDLEVLESLNGLLEAGQEELFERAVEAAAAGATIGEFTSSLRHGDGDRPACEPLRSFRRSELFETLREQIETWRRDNVGPHVFLANIGDVARYMPRVDFARSFFQVAGLELTPVDWWESPDEAAARAVESEAPIVVIVALDETYPEAVPAVARSVKAERPEATVIVAGWPADHVEAFREAGVDEFIHLKCDAFAILAKLAETVGATR